eukprot:3127-Rhodomonas_salina.1
MREHSQLPASSDPAYASFLDAHQAVTYLTTLGQVLKGENHPSFAMTVSSAHMDILVPDFFFRYSFPPRTPSGLFVPLYACLPTPTRYVYTLKRPTVCRYWDPEVQIPHMWYALPIVLRFCYALLCTDVAYAPTRYKPPIDRSLYAATKALPWVAFPLSPYPVARRCP